MEHKSFLVRDKKIRLTARARNLIQGQPLMKKLILERDSEAAYALSAMARLSIDALRTSLAIMIAGRSVASLATMAIAMEESGRSLPDLSAPTADKLVAGLRKIIAETEAKGRIGDARALAERIVLRYRRPLDEIFAEAGLQADDPRCFLPAFLLAERNRGSRRT